jgi:hypothetical protein
MVRMQVQLTEEQMQALRQISASSSRSIADLVREGLDRYLSARHLPTQEERIQRAMLVAGRFASGGRDVSTEHDRHLVDVFGRARR